MQDSAEEYEKGLRL